jgi:homoserine kinase type II
MAVYTELSFEQADRFVQALGRGRLQGLQGIAAGIENTNYFVDTDRGAWVLTLFERLSPEQLPFYLRCMQHLARHGLPVPEPQADASGQILHQLAGRPAALLNRLPGHHVEAPDLAHIAQVGEVLARLHLAGADFTLHQPHLRGLDWWLQTAPQVLPHLDAPRDGSDTLSGLFDFFFAGIDCLAFDIAVCLNDWCIDVASGRLIEEQAAAFCTAYEGVRKLHGTELRLMPAMRRAAALRFWLSRLWDWYLPRDAALLQPKDPDHFERVLRGCIGQPWHPPH